MNENPNDRDYRLMDRAIALGHRNPTAPFGCVIATPDGSIVADGLNRSGENRVLHGEMVALLALPTVAPGAGLHLYTTAEPCPMCMSAALWTGVERIVYGIGIADLTELGWRQIAISAEEVSGRCDWGTARIVGGVRREVCRALFEAALR